jgi:hypothetical protein
MKRFRKSIILPLSLGVMGTAFYIYYGIAYKAWIDNLPNIIIFFCIIIALAWALRKKEKYEEERNTNK